MTLMLAQNLEAADLKIKIAFWNEIRGFECFLCALPRIFFSILKLMKIY